MNMNYLNNNNKTFYPGLYLNQQLYNPYINNMNGFSNQISQNQINMKDFPLLINNNQNNNLINYNYQKFNYNMIPYQTIQPTLNNSIQKQTTNSSNNLPNINNQETSQAKKQEIKNTNTNNNNNNNPNSTIIPESDKRNNSIKINNKNFIMTKPKSNIKGNQKGEKQFLNLDDIVSGKDTNTTVMIRNIPIKYTDKILNEDLNSFSNDDNLLFNSFNSLLS